MVGTKTRVEMSSTYLKQIRKPMIEKQRRERMNHSISQLKLLIAQTIKQNTTPMTRVDKADILELTVYHLQQMQQRSVTMTTELSGHSAGFKDCAREVAMYFSSRDDVSDATVARLNSHLHNTFQMTSHPRLHGNQPHFPQEIESRIRLSTPVRRDVSISFSADVSHLDYSPIPQYSAQMTSPSSLLTSYMSQGSRYSMNDSSSQDSGLCTSSFSDPDSLTYTPSSSSDCSDVIKVKQEVVTIGTGEVNEIGHVISDAPWRPW